MRMEFAGYLLRFNTSHVTLYPEPEKLKIIEDFSFNTSHVTLYPPMSDNQIMETTFQYISCYSLSSASIRLK